MLIILLVTLNTLTEVVVFVFTVLIEVSGLWKMKSIFDCPKYNTCRLDYPEIFLSMENNIKDLLNNVATDGVHQAAVR